MAPIAFQEKAPSLDHLDLTHLKRRVAEVLERRDVRFSGSRFTIDPVPRVIGVEEWRALEAGLAQRVRALSAFVRDVYGERRIVSAGVVPARVIETAEYHEPAMRGVPLVPIVVAGLDVVRDESGEFLVLEDNCRTPSGLAYAIAAREALDACLPAPPGRRGLGGAYDLLGDALRAAAPGGDPDPVVAVLTDGPRNSAHFEHEAIARHLGLPLVTLDGLRRRGRGLFADVRGTWQRVDVVYRRTNQDRLDEPVGRALAGSEATVVNAFGAGVADDKLAHAYVEDMVRFYLGEEPALRSVPTYDLGIPEVRERVLDRIGEVVVKPRAASGGEGILIGPHAPAEEREATAEAVRRAPEDWVAQETISLSCHPTVAGGRLEPRHVDLRAFVFLAGDDATVLPGGLTRVALERGSLIVNSSQGGGAKDTWVMEPLA
jgi:carboxylate-amine ligase